jgi:hypothetical protein
VRTKPKGRIRVSVGFLRMPGHPVREPKPEIRRQEARVKLQSALCLDDPFFRTLEPQNPRLAVGGQVIIGIDGESALRKFIGPLDISLAIGTLQIEHSHHGP